MTLRTAALSASILMLMTGTALAEPLAPMLQDLEQNHPRIKAAAESVKSSEAGKQQAFSGYLPRVNVTANTGYARNDRSDLKPAGSTSTLTASGYGLSVTENVFNGFRTHSTFASAGKNVDIANYTLDYTRQQILFEGIATYLEVLRQIQLTELSLENQNVLKNQLHLEDERVQRGSGIAVDILQAKSRLQISKERYSAFSGALIDAISRYHQVFGKPPEVSTMTLPAIPTDVIPESLESAIDTAVASNPSLKANEVNSEVASLARTTARSGFFPNIDVVGSTTADDNLQGVRGTEANTTLLVRASWEVFSGLADKAGSEKAAFDYQAAIENTNYAKRKVVEDVKLAWSTLHTSKERADLLDNAVNIAGEVYDARRRLRDVGSDTALNVLDAENELFRAKIDATAARFDYYTAVYRLLLAMGWLNQEKIL